MAGSRLNQVLAGLRRRLLPADGAAASDRQLLDRFADGQDQEAFTQLVERHGPMVLGVCRRVLRDHHLAEDAFQATFLVLARKASSSFWAESVRGWLYEVACRTAQKARLAGLRRQRREGAVARSTETQEQMIDDLRQVLDEELRRMPESYRLPILLCCLEDKTVDEAAAELEWSFGEVKGRLQRGRELLRDRLQRRGIALSAGVLASILAPSGAAAAPAALVQSTSQAAVAGNVTALAQGVLQTMFWTKLKMVVVTLAVTTALAYGAGAWWFQSEAAANAPVPDSIANPESKPMPPVSKSVLKDGLEVVVRATKASFGPAESPAFEVIYANRGDKPLRLHDIGFELGHWTCTDAKGPWKMIGPGEREYSARPAPQMVEVKPGDSHIQKYVLQGPFHWEGDQKEVVPPVQVLSPGKYQVTGRIAFRRGPRDNNAVEFWVGEIKTNPVEIEIKAVGDAQSKPVTREGLSMAVTAIQPAYKPGETLSFDVICRNVDPAPFWLHGLLWTRGYDIRIYEAGWAEGYWRPEYLNEVKRANPASDLVRLTPQLERIVRVKLEPVRFQWEGPQNRPRGPLDQLRPGKYQVQIGVDLSQNPPGGAMPGGNRDRIWKGVLTSNRLDFEIKPADGFGPAVEGLASRITLAKEQFAVGEAIPVTYVVKNVSEEERTVWHSGFWPNHKILVHEASGNEAVLTANGVSMRQAFSPLGGRDKNVPVKLKPGEVDTAWGQYDVSKLYDLSKPGRYTVQFVYQEGAMKMLSSNLASFEVVAR